jgi:GDP-L-fucose synthase
MKNILILGGHGFLGKNIAQKLRQENGGNLLIASRRTGVNLFELHSIRACIKSFQPDIIYHCAAHVGALEYFAKFSADILRENLQINLNLYEAVKYECPTCTIINPIANCAYPGNADLQKEENWLNGPVHESVKPFGNARRVVYFLSECYKNQYGIKSKNFLVPNTFGPGDYTDPKRSHALNGMIVRMILAKQRGEKTFQLWGTGNPVREWGYVRDIANVLYLRLSLEED